MGDAGDANLNSAREMAKRFSPFYR